MTIPTILINKVNEEQYNGLPEWKVAELLNTPDSELPTVRQDVANHILIKFLIIHNIWASISYKAKEQTVNETDNTIQIKYLCIEIYDYLTVSESTEATDIEVYNRMIMYSQQLTLLGVTTEEIANEFLKLFNRPQSWAEANDVVVTANTVGLARGGV